MDAIHIIMATSTSANPHNAPNERIENIIRKRKMSAITFLVFGILLVMAGSLLVSFESQRFSVSFIVFGIIGIIFAFMYWISAERILIAFRKYNAERMRQIQLQAQNPGVYFLGNRDCVNSNAIGLPSYEQSVSPNIEIPPPYEEAVKIKSPDPASSSISLPSISLTVDQATNPTTISTQKSS